MKRKLIYLQYILQQDKQSMIFQVFKATCANPITNDFVKTCQKYLDCLDISLSFEEISGMSKYRFKQLVKQKTEEAGFAYLIREKNKQKKISHLKYVKLEMQEYLLEGNRNTRLSKLIFKARGRNLDIKTHKKWKYSDDICVGCGENIESEEELLVCSGFSDGKGNTEKVSYSWFFRDSVGLMTKVASQMEKRLKVRKKMLDEPD